jgi:xanthine dehydrogenase YagR molybdenum-binding subunit
MIEAKTKLALGEEKDKFAMHSFVAIFAEMRVDAEFDEVRGMHVVGTCCVGRAMLEHTIADKRTGRVVNSGLAEYHIPVNADVP